MNRRSDRALLLDASSCTLRSKNVVTSQTCQQQRGGQRIVLVGTSARNLSTPWAVGQWAIMDAAIIREWATDAIRYWEPRRIIYNLVLAGVVFLYFAMGLPHSKQMVNLNFVLFLFLLAVLANVCYCAAYVVDIFAQVSGFRELWQRYRWILLALGIVFAAIITRFWSMAFFMAQ
jgi:hypothetical protein